jgi:hypothetical protein
VYVNLKIFILVSLLAVFPVPQPGHAQGTVIFPTYTTFLSNSGEPVGGSVFYGSDAWIAQSFETGNAPDGYLLNGPTLFAGFAAPTSELSFYRDNNGVPGAALDGQAIILSPSTIYWFVATASEPSQSSGGLQVFPKSWNYAADSNYSSDNNWSLLPVFALSSNGLNWTTETTHGPFQFALSGIPAPEPSVLAFTGIFLSGILFRRRRKTR